VLVPATVAVIAVVFAVWADRGAHRGPTLPAPVPGAATEPAIGAVGDDESWSMLGQLAQELDIDTLSDTLGTSVAAGAANAVYQLNARERASLADLLQAEIGQPVAPE
jgi:hypothetical protein